MCVCIYFFKELVYIYTIIYIYVCVCKLLVTKSEKLWTMARIRCSPPCHCHPQDLRFPGKRSEVSDPISMMLRKLRFSLFWNSVPSCKWTKSKIHQVYTYMYISDVCSSYIYIYNQITLYTSLCCDIGFGENFS